MPRPRVILQSEFPYHVTARCINREWFKLPMDEVWSIFASELKDAVERFDVRIHAFVLMSNHFHLVASTPEANISSALQQFMHRSSLRLARSGNRINETFAGRHKKSIMDSYWYVVNAYKYVYRNAVDGGICEAGTFWCPNLGLPKSNGS